MPVTGGWDRLTPEGEKFFRQIDELQDKEVFVGFQAGKVADDRGVDMAQIAMWNELGTSTAPSRPFLRKSVDENADPINAMCAQQLKSITAGGTAEQSLKQIGVFGVGLVQEKIESGSYEPNAPSTMWELKNCYTLDEALKLYALYRMEQDVEAGRVEDVRGLLCGAVRGCRWELLHRPLPAFWMPASYHHPGQPLHRQAVLGKVQP